VNLQQIFDAGVAGVLAQGGYSYDAGSHGCFYRGPNGCKCALGHSIPDNVYDPRFEWQSPGYSGGESTAKLARLLGAETREDCDVLWDFQNIHDDCAGRGLPLSEFKERCRTFAKQHGLNTDVLS